MRLPRVFAVFALLFAPVLVFAPSSDDNREVLGDSLASSSVDPDDVSTYTATDVGHLLLELSTSYDVPRDELTELLGDLLPSIRKKLRAEDFPFVHILETLSDGTLGVLYHVRVNAAFDVAHRMDFCYQQQQFSGIRQAHRGVRRERQGKDGNRGRLGSTGG
jgi:hypothetical protein